MTPGRDRSRRCGPPSQCLRVLPERLRLCRTPPESTALRQQRRRCLRVPAGALLRWFIRASWCSTRSSRTERHLRNEGSLPPSAGSGDDYRRRPTLVFLRVLCSPSEAVVDESVWPDIDSHGCRANPRSVDSTGCGTTEGGRSRSAARWCPGFTQLSSLQIVQWRGSKLIPRTELHGQPSSTSTFDRNSGAPQPAQFLEITFTSAHGFVRWLRGLVPRLCNLRALRKTVRLANEP